MEAIEFEAVARDHTWQLPDRVPEEIKLRVLVLAEDEGHEAAAEPSRQPRRKPSPALTGSVVMLHDDLVAPAVPEDDWQALR